MKLVHAFSDPTETYPTVVSMEGHYIFGKEQMWYDITAGNGCNVFGFTNEHITNKIKDTLTKYPNCTWTAKPTIWNELENKLGQLLPSKYTAFIPALSGSDSVDNALKIVWRCNSINHVKKDIVLVRKGSFHSGSIIGWKLTDDQRWSYDFPDVEYVDFYDDNFEDVVNTYKDRIGAVIVDTVSWYNGIDSITDDTIYYINKYKYELDYYVIADEIFTGVYRYGSFAHSIDEGLDSDIICFGKAISGGFANLALTVLSKNVYETIAKKENTYPVPLAIGNTRSQNTVGAAAAVAMLEYCDTIDIKELYSQSELFIRQVGELLYTIGEFDVTYRGTTLVCYFGDYSQEQKNDWQTFFLENGIWNMQTSNIRINSFYNLVEDETTKVLETFDKFLSTKIHLKH